MKLSNVLVALSLTSMTFGGVALAKGEKCWDSSGQEVTAKNKKECMKDKTHKWSKNAPKAPAASAPAGDTKTSAPAEGGAAGGAAPEAAPAK